MEAGLADGADPWNRRAFRTVDGIDILPLDRLHEILDTDQL